MSAPPSQKASKGSKEDPKKSNSKTPSKTSSNKKSPSKTSSTENADKGYLCCKEQSDVTIGTECDCYLPEDIKDPAYFTKNEFIYGGPWIVENRGDPFIDAITPMNLPLQGMFKRSFAYYTLKERLPIIITKIIDGAAKKGNTDLVKHLSKLKYDLTTNKPYDKLTVQSDDAEDWNRWIDDTPNKHYFFNMWVFTECYVYRRIREACEMSKGTQNFDPFSEQKHKSVTDTLPQMCVVADEVTRMLNTPEKKAAQFQTLLKLALWANRCDMSLTAGDPVKLQAPYDTEYAGSKLEILVDPVKLLDQLKNNILQDMSKKVAFGKMKPSKKAMDPNDPKTILKQKCSCHKLAKLAAKPIHERPSNEKLKEDEPKRPCPAKIINPTTSYFDIVCDNAGYELFMDLCLADYALSYGYVQKVRFHLKKIPWFVSDATEADFKYLIEQCAKARINKVMGEMKPPPPPKKEKKKKGKGPAGPPAPPPPPDPPTERQVSSDNLNQLAQRWKGYMDEKQFIILADDFWVSPHCYPDMKKRAYNLYRTLQYSRLVLFKGDLNYRKLFSDTNWTPATPIIQSLRGFHPAPIAVLRTVKSEIITGIPKKKYDKFMLKGGGSKDPKWMLTGDYGVIQFCKKREPLKAAVEPCVDYDEGECYGDMCLVHDDLW